MAETTKQTTTTAAHLNVPGFEMFKKMADEQMGRMHQMADEAAKWQAQWNDFANTQIGELSGLMKAQVKYSSELAADLRKMSVETSKKTLELFNR